MQLKQIYRAAIFLGMATAMITFASSKVRASCDPTIRTCFQPQANYTNWKFVKIIGDATPENCIALYKRNKRFYSNGWQNTVEYKQERCNNDGTGSPNQQGVSTSKWHFGGIKANSTPESCTAIYIRNFKYYQNGYKSVQQKREGQCGPDAIQQLVDERENRKREFYQECANKIKYNPNELAYYKDEIVAKVCPESVRKGRFDYELYESERLKMVERFNAEQKIRDQKAAKKRAIKKREFNANMKAATKRAYEINARGGSQKAFASEYIGNFAFSDLQAVLEIVETSSMVPGRTLSNQQVVDLNVKSQLDGGRMSEDRIRIFCAEGKSGYVVDGVLEGSFGARGISVELARWACKKYGFYHP